VSLKPTMSLRPGTLVKHLQLNDKFTDSVDSDAANVDDESSHRDDDTGTFRYH